MNAFGLLFHSVCSPFQNIRRKHWISTVQWNEIHDYQYPSYIYRNKARPRQNICLLHICWRSFTSHFPLSLSLSLLCRFLLDLPPSAAFFYKYAQMCTLYMQKDPLYANLYVWKAPCTSCCSRRGRRLPCRVGQVKQNLKLSNRGNAHLRWRTKKWTTRGEIPVFKSYRRRHIYRVAPLVHRRANQREENGE